MPTMPLSKLLLINDLIKNPTFVKKKTVFFLFLRGKNFNNKKKRNNKKK